MKTCMLVLLAAAASAGCRFSRQTPDGSGTIECTQVQVAPQVAGRIAELPPREGAGIKKADLVAQLDTTDSQLRLREMRAALAFAEAQLALLTAGARAEDIQKAREQLREAEAADRAAQADLRRIRQVFEARSATQKQMDDATSQAERAAAGRAAAGQQLAQLVNGSRAEEIRMAEAQAEQARARVAQAEKALADCTVAAPADGVVTTRSREPGEFVSPGAPLVTISLLDEVWLSVYVPEPRLGLLKLGQSATVRIDGNDRSFAGKVTFISPEAEFTPRNVQTPDERAKLVYRVKITLPNPEGIFKPGMPADGFLEAK